MSNDLSFYFSVFMRRFHYFALVATVVTAAGIATAYLLPTKYYSEATLLVEPPQIPTELATTTVRTLPQEQLQIIEQRLLTRANMLEIANDLRVYSEEGPLFPDQVVKKMRDATDFRIQVGRDQASLVFIGFESKKPQTAAEVVNDYVTRVLEANAETRRGSAEETMQFFDQEVERLAADLSSKSATILEFKNANINALPDNLEYQLARLDSVRTRTGDIDRQITSLGQQRERLILVFNATGGAQAGLPDTRSPERRELDTLNDQLARAVTIYSDTAPQLRVLRNKIAALQNIVDQQSDPNAANAEQSAVTMLDVQLDQIDAQIENIEAERAALASEIERLERNIDATPTNSIALDNLQRDYDNIQLQYNQAVDRASIAATGERIELSSKGERIAIINPPVVPRSPSSPNRLLIAILSLFSGIVVGAGVVFLLELLNRSIRRPIDLSKALGIVPIATLPVMRTPGEIARRRTLMAGAILTSTAGIVAGIVFLHTQIIPLDLLVDRAVQRLGG
jgi:polysaccharide chain length determinant protein (PEP-CTERM system associated)